LLAEEVVVPLLLFKNYFEKKIIPVGW